MTTLTTQKIKYITLSILLILCFNLFNFANVHSLTKKEQSADKGVKISNSSNTEKIFSQSKIQNPNVASETEISSTDLLTSNNEISLLSTDSTINYISTNNLSINLYYVSTYNYPTVSVYFDNYNLIESASIAYSVPGQDYYYTLYNQGNGNYEAYPYVNDNTGLWDAIYINVQTTDGYDIYYYDYEFSSSGSIQVDNANFTVYQGDTEAPIFKSISVDKKIVYKDGQVKISVVAEDKSEIESISVSYQPKDGLNRAFQLYSVGNNTYEGYIPYYYINGNYGNCNPSIILMSDIYGNSTSIYDYNIYPIWGTHNLSDGSFEAVISSCDFDRNDVVDIIDLSILALNYNTANSYYDLNFDSFIDILDIVILSREL